MAIFNPLTVVGVLLWCSSLSVLVSANQYELLLSGQGDVEGGTGGGIGTEEDVPFTINTIELEDETEVIESVSSVFYLLGDDSADEDGVVYSQEDGSVVVTDEDIAYLVGKPMTIKFSSIAQPNGGSPLLAMEQVVIGNITLDFMMETNLVFNESTGQEEFQSFELADIFVNGINGKEPEDVVTTPNANYQDYSAYEEQYQDIWNQNRNLQQEGRDLQALTPGSCALCNLQVSNWCTGIGLACKAFDLFKRPTFIARRLMRDGDDELEESTGDQMNHRKLILPFIVTVLFQGYITANRMCKFADVVCELSKDTVNPCELSGCECDEGERRCNDDGRISSGANVLVKWAGRACGKKTTEDGCCAFEETCGEVCYDPEFDGDTTREEAENCCELETYCSDENGDNGSCTSDCCQFTERQCIGSDGMPTCVSIDECCEGDTSCFVDGNFFCLVGEDSICPCGEDFYECNAGLPSQFCHPNFKPCCPDFEFCLGINQCELTDPCCSDHDECEDEIDGSIYCVHNSTCCRDEKLCENPLKDCIHPDDCCPDEKECEARPDGYDKDCLPPGANICCGYERSCFSDDGILVGCTPSHTDCCAGERYCARGPSGGPTCLRKSPIPGQLTGCCEGETLCGGGTFCTSGECDD